MIKAYLGIGSNLGDKCKNIRFAIKLLKQVKGISVIKVSSLIETDPEGGPPQDKYLNGAIQIETSLKPHALLKALKHIEQALGRVKTVKNGPRVIDLDILTFADKKIDTPDLKIPHPRMNKREFVIKPLKELQCKQ